MIRAAALAGSQIIAKRGKETLTEAALRAGFFKRGSGILARIILRADGGPEIGIGHLMRTLALAEELRARRQDVSLVSQQLPDAVRGQFEGLGVAWSSASVDGPGLAGLAEREGARAVVLDGYSFDDTYLAALAGRGFKITLIDDLARAEAAKADIIVNQNPGADESQYTHCGSDTRLLLGPRYALLRREFLTAERRPREAGAVGRLLVSLGGADPENHTAAIIGALSACNAGGLVVDVVLGPSNRWVADVEEMARSARHKVGVTLGAVDMARRMAAADAAILGGGVSMLEAAFMGLPTLAVIIADNQAAGAAAFAQAGAVLACDLRRGGKNVSSAVADFLSDEEGRAARAERARAMVDGEGPARVVNAILTA